MKISFLIPSYGKPELLWRNVLKLASLADNPDNIEVIIRADLFDFTLPAILTGVPVSFKNISIIIGHHGGGYASLNVFYEECARLATGDFLWMYNDDFEMLTPGYDTVVSHAPEYGSTPYMPFICNGSDTAAHPSWSAVIVPRQLYQKLGEICPGGHVTYDRSWEAVSLYSGKWRGVNVTIRHAYKEPVYGNQNRDNYISDKKMNYESHKEQWDTIGRECALKLRSP